MALHRRLKAQAEPTWRAFHNAVVLRADTVTAQGLRYMCSGVMVNVVYVSITMLLAEVVRLRFQLALVIGWCAGVTVHYTLQRTFVWAREHDYALSFSRQLGRYLIVAVSQLGIVAVATSTLPSLLGVSSGMVYLAMGALITVVNFLVFRHGVFYAMSGEVTSAQAR